MNQQRFKEIATLFLKLGLVAFGGPAAHIAMMHEEVVERRGWIGQQHFLDLVSATNLIPGPNSTEMTMHLGYERGGWSGLFVAGFFFITPAVLLTGLSAWLYVTYGTLPQVQPLLVGIKPAVIAVILSAVWKLGHKAVKSRRLALLGLLIFIVAASGLDKVLVLFAGGLLGGLVLGLSRRGTDGQDGIGALLGWPALSKKGLAVGVGTAVATIQVSLWQLGLFFLKVGAILYGSGYVLIVFLEGELVQELGWLTQTQLLDAIAIGQFTPGPVLSTATFIGYIIAGPQGALVATLGIFLPFFIFVLFLNPLVPRLRERFWTAVFLDAVNVAALALMVVVAFELGREVLLDWQAWLIAALAALLTFRFNINPAWIILGGAMLGYGLYLI